MRECSKYEVTIEKLMNIVHNYTDPIRVHVVMADACLTCEEAKRMHDFDLIECFRGSGSEKGQSRRRAHNEVLQRCSCVEFDRMDGWSIFF